MKNWMTKKKKTTNFSKDNWTNLKYFKFVYDADTRLLMLTL